MYLKSFGLNEKPFHITPNPRFIFLSKNHKEAFAHLLYGIQQRVGFLSLTGEVGTGKTTVLRTLLQQLEESTFKVALIFNPCLTDLELLQSVHREFGIEFSVDKANLVSLHDSLNKFLLAQREAGKTVVLVVDEAQNLDPSVLEQLRLLSNLETETEKLIQMVLVGQPELDELFNRNDLRQLRQRLAVRYQLKPMDAEDTSRYVQHRVRIAGWQNGALFSDKALQRIYRITGGTPRLINILCDRAMLVAYGRDSRAVTHQDVANAQAELGSSKLRSRSRLLPAIAFILLSFVVGFAGSQYLTYLQSNTQRFRIPEQLMSTEEPVVPAVASLAQAQAQAQEPLPAERIQQLQQSIADLSIDQSVTQAYQATADLWGRKRIALPLKPNRSALKVALMKNGFNSVDFQGELNDLIAMNSPSVLEIVLPNVEGKRYLALVEVTDDQVRTVPALTATGWISKRELKYVWFGRAILPYVNFENIRLIHTPDQAGADIEKVQSLLQKLYGEKLDSGIYDRQTIEAVTRFQIQHQLAPDGRVGSRTLFWMYKETGREMPRLDSGGAS